MEGIEVYKGRAVDEDEDVIGIQIDEQTIFQFTEYGKWSKNCGTGYFKVIPETIVYAGQMDIGDLRVLPRTEEVQEYFRNLPKKYLVACWARYGILEFPVGEKVEYNTEKDIITPFVWMYDDCNGTTDAYFLRKITDTTTASIWNWYDSKSVAEEVAKKLNEKFDK